MSDQPYSYQDQNLQGQSFVGMDLTGSDFSGADLRGCDFTRATLVGANFERVITGQTPQQINDAILAIVLGAIAILLIAAIISFAVIQIDSLFFSWFGEIYRKISGVLAGIFISLLYFFQNDILERFPKTSRFLGDASLGILFIIMLLLTLWLAVISFAGSGAILFLIPMAVSAIVTFKIFTWLLESISNRSGTSFKKANLTGANFRHALIYHTDFSFALLTGICIEGWLLDSQTLFTKSQCQYVYLQPEQERYPHTGNFQERDWENFLRQFITQNYHLKSKDD
jgi:hypothetical protein